MRLWRRVLARAGAVSIRHYFPSSTAQSLSVADSDEAHQYVRKTCLERFPHATSFRHDLPCIFLASGKPFQPLLAACRKTSVSRHPHRCLTRPSGSRTFCFSYDRSRRIFLVSAYAYQQSVSLVEANSGYRAWRGRPVESGKIGQTPAPFRSQMNRIAETQRVRRRQRVGLVRPSLTKSDSSERQTY